MWPVLYYMVLAVSGLLLFTSLVVLLPPVLFYFFPQLERLGYFLDVTLPNLGTLVALGCLFIFIIVKAIQSHLRA
jgi:hypothetical protein